MVGRELARQAEPRGLVEHDRRRELEYSAVLEVDGHTIDPEHGPELGTRVGAGVGPGEHESEGQGDHGEGGPSGARRPRRRGSSPRRPPFAGGVRGCVPRGPSVFLELANAGRHEGVADRGEEHGRHAGDVHRDPVTSIVDAPAAAERTKFVAHPPHFERIASPNFEVGNFAATFRTTKVAPKIARAAKSSPPALLREVHQESHERHRGLIERRHASGGVPETHAGVGRPSSKSPAVDGSTCSAPPSTSSNSGAGVPEAKAGRAKRAAERRRARSGHAKTLSGAGARGHAAAARATFSQILPAFLVDPSSSRKSSS